MLTALEFVLKCLMTGFVLFVGYRNLYPHRTDEATLRALVQRYPHLKVTYGDDGTFRPLFKVLSCITMMTVIVVIWLRWRI